DRGAARRRPRGRRDHRRRGLAAAGQGRSPPARDPPGAAGLKIGLVHYSAPPVIGGVESIVGAHARLLREAGHDVRLVAGQGDAELVPELDSLHEEVESVTSVLATGRLPRGYRALRDRLKKALEPLLRDRDVVVAHNVLTMPFNLPAAEALLGLGRPLVAWTHDLAWINPRYREFRREELPWSLLGNP